MITRSNGNLLEADVEALVNTVNTVGVMGKGIALQFKKAFPANFKAYERACRKGEVQLGSMFVFDNGQLTRPNYIINFPTKKHWRSRSRLADVAAGIEDLAAVIRDLGIRSIAVPPLGCGNGGLNWDDVAPLIDSALGSISGVDVLVFGPDGAPAESAMPVASSRPRMTPGRAALIAILDRYLRAADTTAGVSQIELQKLMYFLQSAGQALRLLYVKGLYGPYAENLNHVLVAIDGHYLEGFGDRTRAVHEMAALSLLPGAVEEAEAFLADDADTRTRFEMVLDLIDGFESPYGLELLSSVHWIAATEDPVAATDPQRAVAAVQKWTPRKGRLFTERHITIAWQRLRDHTGEWFLRPAGAPAG